MNTKKEVGDYGEKIAQEFLIEAGYYFIEKNFRGKAGEIDLIVKDRDHLVFVEVKTRKNKDYMNAREAVNTSKQNKIKKTARDYIFQKRIHYKYIRFDVLEYYTDTKEVDHFIDAF